LRYYLYWGLRYEGAIDSLVGQLNIQTNGASYIVSIHFNPVDDLLKRIGRKTRRGSRLNVSNTPSIAFNCMNSFNAFQHLVKQRNPFHRQHLNSKHTIDYVLRTILSSFAHSQPHISDAQDHLIL